MTHSHTAADQLERILYVLPAAAREGGVPLDELAGALGVCPRTLSADITDVVTRAYYHPAESGSDLQVHLYSDRVEIFTTGDFQRPVRLSVAEAVCLGLALRGAPGHESATGDPAAGATAGSADTAATDAHSSLTRLEEALVGADAAALLAELETADLRPGGTGIRETVSHGLEEKTALRIRYFKPPEPAAPAPRTVHPYALVLAEGLWYLLAFCEVSQEVRIFRMDRILEAAPTGKPFETPTTFDAGAYLQGSRVFRGGEQTSVRVRYTARIARWLAEREQGDWDPDGSLVVTHRVVDPHWLVRHVLQYGPDAEVLEPEEARGWVRDGLSGPPE